MYRIIVSPKFQKSLKGFCKSNPKIKPKVKGLLEKLLIDPRHPSLRLHKLGGKDIWSISLTMKTRVSFKIEGNKIYLLKIGSHDRTYR